MQKIIVVIPIYKEYPTKSEMASLRQCAKILSRYNIIFVAPEGLNSRKYENVLTEENCKYSIEYFNENHFVSCMSYSKLLLEEDFYKRFEDYDFMFLYQLDGWVFRDELEYWCNQGFDYIGAPWFEGFDLANENSPFISPSGNGGVSLRNIKVFIDILAKKEMVYGMRTKSFFEILKERAKIKLVKALDVFRIYKLYSAYENNAKFYFEGGNEDYAIVRFFPIIDKNFKIAPNTVNYKFSFEVQPRRLFKMNDNKLPFACHAFERYDYEFWKEFIKF